MEIRKVKTEGYASNCYLLVSGGEAAVVDPSAEIPDLERALDGLSLKYILLTHGHYDHILKLRELRESYNAPVCIHEGDSGFLKSSTLSLFIFIGKDLVFEDAELILQGGETLILGDEKIKVFHTPGHTAGSVCYVCGDDIITGDTLFDMSVGRWDLPTGDGEKLRSSVKTLTDTYPRSTIYPGHGDCATMEKQIKLNPYTKGMI